MYKFPDEEYEDEYCHICGEWTPYPCEGWVEAKDCDRWDGSSDKDCDLWDGSSDVDSDRK